MRGQGSEDSGLRGQKTDELAALSRRSEDRKPSAGFRGQRFERTEDRETERSVFRPHSGAKRRKLICLLSSRISVL
ncbi:MAG: hypothetical protein LBD06_01340 [Candidatus Accumulibacter sp.]|nr:hypothetical protein [Accumulibacter sp.]